MTEEKQWRFLLRYLLDGMARSIFLEAPSPLFRLLFTFVIVSIGVSVVVLAYGFPFPKALVAGSSGYSVMLAGVDTVAEAGTKTGVEVGSTFFTGEAVGGFYFLFVGDIHFFRVTSVQPSL